MNDAAKRRAAALAIWTGPVDPQPLGGGITNTNFLVEDRGRRYVVRVGDDIPVHGVMRFNELAASRAAHAAGISPAFMGMDMVAAAYSPEGAQWLESLIVVHAEPGILVLDYIDGRTFGPADVRANIDRLVELVRRAHREIPKHLRGPALVFWVFHVLRDYAHTLDEADFRLRSELPRYLAVAGRLEAAVGPVELVYGHNDLLAANFIDDGERIWLVDWDYAGFNSPLFDLGGLASNNELDEAERERVLELYFDRPVDDALRYRAQAMLTASLLREAMWSMVSEVHSAIDFDFRAYTEENLRRFERALATFQDMEKA